MRLVIEKNGAGIRTNPFHKSTEEYKRRCKHRNPRLFIESNEPNKETAQSVEYGTGISSTELADVYNIDAKPNLDEESYTDDTSRSNSIEENDITDDSDGENSVDGDEMKDQSVSNGDEEANIAGTKRKYLPSFIDSIINRTSEESSMSPQPKIKCIPEYYENNEQTQDTNSDHSLSKIPPTERKKWPQKPCVHCRRKYGFRNDTRFICILCNAALCKKPCFSEYHCTK